MKVIDDEFSNEVWFVSWWCLPHSAERAVPIRTVYRLAL